MAVDVVPCSYCREGSVMALGAINLCRRHLGAATRLSGGLDHLCELSAEGLVGLVEFACNITAGTRDFQPPIIPSKRDRRG